MSRRRLLRAAAGGLVATLAGAVRPRSGFAQNGHSLGKAALRDGLTLLTGAGGNVVVFATDGGIALVDSGAPDAGTAVSSAVGMLAGGAPVDILFNTHWHLDHTGGNETCRTPGTRIVAHENTRLWMSTEYYVDWQDRTYAPRVPAALPNETFHSHEPQPITVDLGGEPIEYAHLREAHTDGDIYVRFPDRNVIAAGGAVASGEYPVLDFATGGWIGGLMDATASLIGLADADTLIVPGRGAIRTRADLEGQLDMLGTVRERIEDLMRRGMSAEEMLAAGVTAEFDAAWGDNRERFVTNIYGGLWWQGRLQQSL